MIISSLARFIYRSNIDAQKYFKKRETRETELNDRGGFLALTYLASGGQRRFNNIQLVMQSPPPADPTTTFIVFLSIFLSSPCARALETHSYIKDVN